MINPAVALGNWLRVQVDNPDLALAKYRALTRQVTFIYILCVVCGWAIVITHWNIAPIGAVIYYPVFVTAFAIYRISVWMTGAGADVDTNLVIKRLRGANRLAVANPILFGLWAAFLFPYGDAYLQSQIAFTVCIANFACTVCLVHLRSAMVINTLCTNTIFFIYLATVGDPVFLYFAATSIAVSVVVLFVFLNNYKDFVRLVGVGKALEVKTRELEARQLQSQELIEENNWLANHDPLTGLPNRRLFFRTLETKYAVAVARGAALTVCIVDLGGFKPINDIHGHEVGDSLLIETGARLKRVFPGAFSARLGGDEFAVIVEGGTDQETLRALGESALTIFDAAFRLPEGRLKINGFAGLAVYPARVSSSIELFEQALYALQSAKRDPVHRFAVYGDRHSDEMRQTVLLERALLSPGLAKELTVAFQPIIDIRTNSVHSFECLARWTSAELGPIPPDVFIPVAERAGFINRLTLLLLDKALTESKAWPNTVQLSFNLSPSNLSSGGFMIQLLDLLAKHSFDPRRLDCEITETAVMWDFEQAQSAIAELKEAGIGISLDDFGTGYSSLRHIHLLPLDKIKIDRSFVRGIQPNSVGYGIVKSLLILSRDMGIRCVVEGVETKSELSILRSLGAELIQGYYFSKPLPARDVDAYLNGFQGTLPAHQTRAF